MLLRLAEHAAAESNPNRFLRVLLSEAKDLLDGTGAVLTVWDNDAQLLVEGSTTRRGNLRRNTLRLGEGVSGRAADTRAPVLVNDYQRLENPAPEGMRSGVHAALAAPMLHEGRLLGVLTIVSHRAAHRFSSDDAELLVILAGIGASTLVALERKRAEARLKRETERFEKLVETTSDSIIITDRDMRLLAWNRGAEHLYGWHRREVLGRAIPWIAADRMQHAQELWRRVVDNGETIVYEETRLAKDGRRIPVMATISAVRDETLAIVGVIGIAKDLTALKELEEQRTILARLDERESIAMDLHDNTLQALHGAILLLAATERHPETDVERVRALIADARRELNTAVLELDRYLLEMHQRAEPRKGLSAGLLLLGQLARSHGLTAEVRIDETIDLNLTPQSLHHLLTIAREATFNAVRHAQAASLCICLNQANGRVTLSIADDGCGFEQHGATSGRGLANMSERARILGAHWTIVTSKHTGTVVRLELPPRGSLPRRG